jgi:LPXTG-motif cell wall-anchored protein
MERGLLRVIVRYPLVLLVEQGRLGQEEAGREMGLSTRQVRRVLAGMAAALAAGAVALVGGGIWYTRRRRSM